MNLKTNLANRGNYGGTRSTAAIKYIVVHYTGNDGDTDENNGNYFKNNVVKSSAHYFVDDDSVTQSVPDGYVAWHCGANTYKHPVCRNNNSIGVEICDDVRNGTVYPSNKTIENALELVEYLMKKYDIPKENVIRHYDVTGKICPEYWCGTTTKDKKWKTAFWNKLGAKQNTAQAPAASTPAAAIEIGSKVEFKPTAEQYYPGGKAIPLWVKGYYHIVSKVKSNGKAVIKGDKECVLLSQKVDKASGAIITGINTWVAADNLSVVSGNSGYEVYTVKENDTLWQLASSKLGAGSRYTEIMNLNGLSSTVITKGQKLKIPKG